MRIDSETHAYQNLTGTKTHDPSLSASVNSHSQRPAYEVNLSSEAMTLQMSVPAVSPESVIDSGFTSPVTELSTLSGGSGGSVSVKQEIGVRVLKIAVEQQAEILSLLV